MQRLTAQGQQMVENIAQRYGVSADAGLTMLQALIAGNGAMAQFNHPELGGSGQWMQGGMIMVGDMFNNALKAKIDGLCSELSRLLTQQLGVIQSRSSQSQTQSQGGQQQGFGVSLFVPATGEATGHWWPAELGAPSSTGVQNNIRYAYFPAARRLAIEINGHVTIYDTLDHQISGVSQQQSAGASLTFTSQFGLVQLASLPMISDGVAQAKTSPAAPKREQSPSTPAGEGQEDIIAKIERLAELRKKGVLSEQEFASKKAELLKRL